MTKSIALVGYPPASEAAQNLAGVLAGRGFQVRSTAGADTRHALRWMLELNAEEVALCILAGADEAAISAAMTALDPAIAILIWMPEYNSADAPSAAARNSRALFSFAANAELLADAIGLMRGEDFSHGTTDAPSGELSITPNPSLASAVSAPEEEPGPSPVQPVQDSDDQDKAALRELELLMAARKKNPVRHEPVQIQEAALDFSLPLRELMTAGSDHAQRRGHREVTGLHYLAQVGDPFREILDRFALDGDVLAGALQALDGPSDKGHTVVSDEVFDAVRHAKDRARKRNAGCVQTIDFLVGLITAKGGEGSLATLIESLKINALELENALVAAAPADEPCSVSFFKPSPLDQAGFYEFDPAQVEDVASRLKELPAFKKAAARVAEAKRKDVDAHVSGGASARPEASRPAAINVPPAAPPERPEILKVRGDFPDVDIVEQVADFLLEGQIVAFPTDTMLAVAVDAANAAAVQNLRSMTAVPNEKPLSLLINSTAQLKHLVRADLDALEPLLDELWPGALTLIFNAAPGVGRHLTAQGKIALRLPGDNLALSILSMLGRPLVVTSWDQDVAGLMGSVGAIVSTDEPPPDVQTTVVDLTASPWAIKRTGMVDPERVLRFQV